MHTPAAPAVLLAREAMNTRFELVLHGGDPVRLRAAGEEALDEIERIESRLSLFRPTSEIAHVNAWAARQPVRVSPPTFALLQQAKQLHAETDGAFDPTIAPLLHCWGLLGRNDGRLPGDTELAAARACTGLGLVELDAREFTVRFARDGVMLDLGAIGKGHAVDEAITLLREAGVTSALLHAGTSSVFALGTPPDAEAWKIAMEGPPNLDGRPRQPLATLRLRDESLGVSAAWGKCFTAGAQTYGHVLDPRDGRPARHAVLAAVALPFAAEADALSTALLVLGAAGLQKLKTLRPTARALIASAHDGQLAVSQLAIAAA
jgi:thiamine biosynthesis lipoprotein